MSRVLPSLLLLGLTIYALIDCIQTPSHEVRNLPKAGWIALIIFGVVLGPVAWLYAGRPRAGRTGGVARPGPGRGGPGWSTPGRQARPVAPDDDPEFLRRLDRQRNREHEDLLRRWEEDLREREERLRDGDGEEPGEDDRPH